MKVFNGFENVPPFPRGAVVAVGNFDGIHLGHRKILERVLELAAKKGLFALVLTFFPHPARSLNKRDVPLIQTLGQRLEGLRGTGLKGVVVVPLGRGVRRLSGRAFAGCVLKGALHAEEVVVGENFRFGKDRRYGVAELTRLGRELGFGVHGVPPVEKAGEIVSSSLIRHELAKGNFEKAAELLGRPYEIEGCVVTGESRGRVLGFPTANIQTTNEIVPRGVFVTLAVTASKSLPSVTDVGVGPTFGGSRLRIETHVLDHKGNLYGRTVKLRFLKKLRNERKFGTSKALIAQISRDVAEARRFFR
jgi:riboflavin kinase/FMN adenylyltransferase